MVHSVVVGADVVGGDDVPAVEGEVVAVGALVEVFPELAGVVELLQAARPSATATDANPRAMGRRPFRVGEPLGGRLA
jgi:hypothetical protein